MDKLVTDKLVTDKKYSIKSITLYELCANNDILLISTIHHAFILIFNYYAIINMNFLQHKNNFIKFQTNFELIQQNLEVCQVITFFTVFFVFYCSKPLSEQQHYMHKNNNIIAIMVISFVSKITFAIYQLYIYRDIHIEYNIEEKDSFGPFYTFIELSYIIRISMFIGLLAISIIIPTFIMCDKMIDWSKNYRLTFRQEKSNDGSEDV